MAESLARQNYALECEAAINRQINMELSASYAYFAVSVYYDHDTVALPHAAKFFMKMSHEEREHAEKFAKYQVQRGGWTVLQDIKKPAKVSFESLQDAMETALQMEKDVNESILGIHKLASEKNDVALAEFLEREFLHEQVESIKEFAEFVTKTKRVGPGLGEYLFDKLTLKE